MKTISAVILVSVICVSSLINLVGSVGHGFDSSTKRSLMDKNINYKDRRIWMDLDARLRSNYDPNAAKLQPERPTIRHSHLHRDEQSHKKNSKHGDKFLKINDWPDSRKINNNTNMGSQQKLTEIEARDIFEKYTTQKTLTMDNLEDKSVDKSKNNKIVVTDEAIDEDDNYVDEYEDEDGFYDDDDDDDDEEHDEDVDNDDEMYAAEESHNQMHYKPPETDTKTDLFNFESSQDDYGEWVDSPQADASDGPGQTEEIPKTLKWVRVPVGHNRGNKKVKTEAQQHVRMMANQGVCKHPQPRVITVQNVHPNPSKRYTPHCTILHRCGEDTGCCLSDIATCSAKTTETVHLYFYTKAVGHENMHVEKLAFENHTECECAEKKSDIMVKDDIAFLSIRPTAAPWRETIVNVETETPPAPLIKKCHCPTEYSVHMLGNGDCECDCFNKQKDCMRIKRGKEYFGLKDRLCIQRGHCQRPNCEFGIYNSKSGRCPKRQEQIEDSTAASLKSFGK